MKGGSVQASLDRAESCRERAALYRRVIERAERPRGRATHPGWAKTKAILLEVADDLECEAREAEAQAAQFLIEC
jgi:hypothetical protein